MLPIPPVCVCVCLIINETLTYPLIVFLVYFLGQKLVKIKVGAWQINICDIYFNIVFASLASAKFLIEE